MDYNYIGTYTNKNYHFLNPTIEEVCIEDIAQALSMSCRYSGHVKSFYSVAEHSCLISDLVMRITQDAQESLDALLHDGSEAYLTDVPRPIKGHLTNYYDLEKLSEKVIQQKFNIRPMSCLIKHIDTNICGEEARQLFKHPPEWCDDYDKIDIEVLSWNPEQAKQEFLQRFNKLSNMR